MATSAAPDDVREPTHHRVPVPAGQLDRSTAPIVRIGMLSGLVGMLCCVGPTVLAAVGILSAGTAFTAAQQLYGGYAWWFRLAALVLVVLLVRRARRRGRCVATPSQHPARPWLMVLAVAAATYLLLYAGTTALGTLAH